MCFESSVLFEYFFVCERFDMIPVSPLNVLKSCLCNA